MEPVIKGLVLKQSARKHGASRSEMIFGYFQQDVKTVLCDSIINPRQNFRHKCPLTLITVGQ
jgi:hypothetical protein